MVNFNVKYNRKIHGTEASCWRKVPFEIKKKKQNKTLDYEITDTKYN